MTKLMRCDDTGACMFDVSTGSGSIIIWSPDDPIPEDLDRKLFQSAEWPRNFNDLKSSRVVRLGGAVVGVPSTSMQRSMAASNIQTSRPVLSQCK
jgi:hypothetical protein